MAEHPGRVKGTRFHGAGRQTSVLYDAFVFVPMGGDGNEFNLLAVSTVSIYQLFHDTVLEAPAVRAVLLASQFRRAFYASTVAYCDRRSRSIQESCHSSQAWLLFIRGRVADGSLGRSNSKSRLARRHHIGWSMELLHGLIRSRQQFDLKPGLLVQPLLTSHIKANMVYIGSPVQCYHNCCVTFSHLLATLNNNTTPSSPSRSTLSLRLV
mmetsp:Transcript_7663/g.13432  ORF Transcript_7663/g.13432 Transcript_7663/m.13432 type:complete len:210 (-) Transcript_7663:76-705(-)